MRLWDSKSNIFQPVRGFLSVEKEIGDEEAPWNLAKILREAIFFTDHLKPLT